MEVEWLILADAAQVVGNKLYIMGGGWDVLTVHAAFPVQQRCGVAVAVKVPWNETNTRHTFELDVVTEDGKSLGRMNGQFEVGRPAGIPPGQDQRVQIAADLSLRLEHAGGYAIMARIDGEEARRTAFTVIGGLPPKPSGPPKGGAR